MIRIPQRQSPYRIAAAVLLLLPFILLQAGYARTLEPDLAARVAALKLGLNGYTIGARLTEPQKETAAANLNQESYPGTYKFQDGDLFVIATEADDTVLAIYQRNEAADMDGARIMVSGLMGLLGEPTTMAHDKMIYWAFTGEGKITEDAYRQLRGENKTIDILATVKFSSSFEITGDESVSEKTGVNYFIMSSDPLTSDFINRDK